MPHRQKDHMHIQGVVVKVTAIQPAFKFTHQADGQSILTSLVEVKIGIIIDYQHSQLTVFK